MSVTTESSAAGTPRLLEEFAPHSYEDWHAAAVALLKGAPFEKMLVTKTHEGFPFDPIYRREDLEGIAHLEQMPGLMQRVRGGNAAGKRAYSWAVSQELPCSTPEEFNSVAMADLKGGVSELNILLDNATRCGTDPDQAKPGEVGACGLSLATIEDLERSLRGIYIEAVSTYLRVGSAGLPVAALFFALARQRGLRVEDLCGCIEMDPLHSLAWKGSLSVSLSAAYREMALLTQWCADHAPGMQTIGVQTQIYHDAGGNATQELAFALATGVEYLRAMQERGLSPELVAPRMRFAMAIGGNFFIEVAKFRAFRLLWSQVLESFGVPEEKCTTYLHGRTGLWNKTIHDPHVNMLRTTTEAFSAVVGGVDGMHVGPFDEVFNVPDTFSRRIARNTHHILAEECDLTKVIDPAGGAYAVEVLTDNLAKDAWQLFQEVEAEGGMLSALRTGLPQKAVAKTSAGRAKLIAQRRDVLVGTNMYPNANEKPQPNRVPDYEELFHRRARAVASHRQSADSGSDTRILAKLAALMDSEADAVMEAAIAALSDGATLGEIGRTLRAGDEPEITVEPLKLSRGAAPYERIRSAVAEYAARTGSAPKILQANLGPSRGYRIRADWTSAFFQTGGFDVLNDRDFDDIDAAVDAAGETKAPIVILTSSDKTYAESVVDFAQKLKVFCPDAWLIVAGMPGDNEATWRDAGVDDFVHVRVNNYEMLKGLLDRLGIQAD